MLVDPVARCVDAKAKEIAVMDKLPTDRDCALASKLAVSLASESFPHARIVRADVKSDWDHDGDPVLWMRLVMDIPNGNHLDSEAKYQFDLRMSRELEDIGIVADTVTTYALHSEVGDAA